MIKFLLLPFMLFSSLYADIVYLEPFITDDSNNQHRRLVVIDDCLSRIERKMKKNPELEKIRNEIETIKFCLGYEVDIANIHRLYGGND